MRAFSFRGCVMSFKSRVSVAAGLLRARMSGWLYVSVGLAVATLFVAPYQFPVTLYKLSLITVGAWLGYWLDRSLFRGAQPGALLEWQQLEDGRAAPLPLTREQAIAYAAAMLRRALIIAAVVIAVALGA